MHIRTYSAYVLYVIYIANVAFSLEVVRIITESSSSFH